MDKFFLSEKNVTRQCATLERILNIKDNPESKRKCKKFILQQILYASIYQKSPGMNSGQILKVI